MKDIVIRTIPLEEQRYNTAGDYWETDTEIHFRITKQEDERSEWAILLHEMTEFALTKQHGITEEQITDYDLKWEVRFNEGSMSIGANEPGDEKDCPYKDEHSIALIIERIYCMAAGVDWWKHDEQIISRQNARESQK
jgi:hypothetical protein